MSLAKVFPFLVVVFWTSAPAESIDPTCISNLVRPSNSHIELQLPELNVPLPEYGDVVDSMLTRHHIIPRSTLLPFFLGALTNENWRPRFVQFLRSLSSAHYSPSDDEVLNGVETHLPVDRNAELGALRALWLRFCWMPFNFFMGPMPHYRSDDPGEAWEGNTEPIVGDRIFEKMHSLITSMNMMISDDHRHIDQKVYSANSTRHNTGAIDFNSKFVFQTDDFNDAMKLLEMLHETITNPYEFERQHWIETPGETMKYHIRTINDSADRNYLRRRRSTYSSDIMSVVAADPYCLETDHTIAEALRNSTFWLNLKTDTLYDLEAVNLLTTQQTIAAVSIVESKFDFATWKDWYRTLNDTVSAAARLSSFVSYALSLCSAKVYSKISSQPIV